MITTPEILPIETVEQARELYTWDAFGLFESARAMDVHVCPERLAEAVVAAAHNHCDAPTLDGKPIGPANEAYEYLGDRIDMDSFPKEPVRPSGDDVYYSAYDFYSSIIDLLHQCEGIDYYTEDFDEEFDKAFNEEYGL